jgi:hypothetical protein
LPPEEHTADSPISGAPEKTKEADRFLVFADMLGFATLTEENAIDIARLRISSHPGSWNWDDIVSKPKNPLTEAFSSFHSAVKGGITIAEIHEAVTAITFSDSVFFAGANLPIVAGFAIDLAHSLLCLKVPVRMGLAKGSFAALRFRSDVSLDGGDHAAQFLGTAVVRAHRAEACGVKGMRILVHPSIESMFGERLIVSSSTLARQLQFLPLPQEQLANSAGVNYELGYWDLATTKEEKAWHSLQDMWDKVPDSEAVHYSATAEAINRMRMGLGEESLKRLRRRTLPRRKR